MNLRGAWRILAGTVVIGLRDARASDIGTGFGETLQSLASARQAGTGGVALEDPWRSGTLADASTVLLEPGLRWLGAGFQGGASSTLRVGGEAFLFSAAEAARTLENADGTFGGERGTTGVQEWGGRALGQLTVWDSAGWRVAGLARVSVVYQALPDARNVGLALEAGGQAMRAVDEGTALTMWVLGGPLGRGADRGFSRLGSCGAGWLTRRDRGFFCGADGYGVGADARWLGEGLLHGGLGGVYWMGRPDQTGFMVSVRAGIRSAAGSAQTFQPHGGVGVLWRRPTGWAIQLDYAVAPLGELGLLQYATVGVRLPGRQRATEAVQPEAQPETAPFPVVASPPSAEEVLAFYPEKGEKAQVTVHVNKPSTFGASLVDEEGRLVRVLVEPYEATPGTYEVVWDGNLAPGQAAPFDVLFTIRISHDNETRYVKATPRKENIP